MVVARGLEGNISDLKCQSPELCASNKVMEMFPIRTSTHKTIEGHLDEDSTYLHVNLPAPGGRADDH